MKKRQFLAVAAATVLLCACGGKKGGMSLGDNEFPVETVSASSAESQTSYPATIKGMQDVEIRPKVAGFITKINVKEGQAVGAGQTLFEIDNATYQAAVRQAEAAVNSAKSALNTAKLTYDNNKQLYDNKVIGDYQLQSSANTYSNAQASLAQAQAALASAKETLSYCYVKSPSAGVIGQIPYKVGALVSSSSASALTTVSNISSMDVYFSMTEKDVLSMTKAQGNTQTAIAALPDVRLKLADGTIYEHPGKVTKMSGVIDATTGSVQLIARFPNPGKVLKSGGSGSIIIPKANSAAIVVPMASTTEVQNKIFVYTVGKDNKVKYTEVKVDPQNDGNNYVIIEGLNIGDRYVTNGLTKLTNGMEIKPITKAQYEKKLKDAEKLSQAQGNADDFANAMSK